jgi:hypothetical protein
MTKAKGKPRTTETVERELEEVRSRAALRACRALRGGGHPPKRTPPGTTPVRAGIGPLGLAEWLPPLAVARARTLTDIGRTGADTPQLEVIWVRPVPNSYQAQCLACGMLGPVCEASEATRLELLSDRDKYRS